MLEMADGPVYHVCFYWDWLLLNNFESQISTTLFNLQIFVIIAICSRISMFVCSFVIICTIKLAEMKQSLCLRFSEN